MAEKPIDQQIYEARCRARGVEPKEFGRLDLEQVNEERRKAREVEKAQRGDVPIAGPLSRGARDDG